jgi:hypothetical protein
MTELKHLVLDFRTGEVVACVLYRSRLDGPNTGTKARRQEVSELAREGLGAALEALEGLRGSRPGRTFFWPHPHRRQRS